MTSTTGSLHGLRVGVDIDGVVADYTSAVRAAAVRIGMDIDGSTPPTTYGMVESGWFPDSAAWLTAHTAACRVELRYADELDPTAGPALALLRELGAQTVFVTARHGIAGDDKITDEFISTLTREWLYDSGLISDPRVEDSVIFAKRKSTAGCDVYLDDAPCQIAELTCDQKFAVVRDAPYNQSTHPDLVALDMVPARVRNLADFARLMMVGPEGASL